MWEEGSDQRRELLLVKPYAKLQVMNILKLKSYEELKQFLLHLSPFLFSFSHFLFFNLVFRASPFSFLFLFSFYFTSLFLYFLFLIFVRFTFEFLSLIKLVDFSLTFKFRLKSSLTYILESNNRICSMAVLKGTNLANTFNLRTQQRINFNSLI